MPLSPEDRVEFKRGLKDARIQLPLVQGKWPKGFPIDPKRVRPLVLGIVPVIAGEMGWNSSYTRGVLLVWKLRMAYCKAVLQHDKRYRLDGTISDETIDTEARASATEALDRLAAKRAKALAKAQGQTVAPPARTDAGRDTVLAA